ncbi:hypothetical protein GCM10009665_77860 [Kitasatospora nipponensis]|uniref:TAT (Twin-arginine translocation) pathway-exported protein n=1 Tax=Kitasatospora nipponensis TaxID=258049 RepID=A0ABP4DTF2_9ACTN
MPSPSRRTFLTAGTLAAAGLLAACTSSGAGSGSRPGAAGGGKADPRSDPDLPLRTRAVAATDLLLAQYAALPAKSEGKRA